MSAPTRGETFVMQGGPERPIDFTAFLLGLASTALIHLGEAPNPEAGGMLRVDLAQARQSVDLLSLLRDKTRGNLTAEEERLFDNLLTELRLKFVEASRR